MKTRISPLLLMLTVVLLASDRAAGQGTAFTYQGRLTDNAQPANGHYDLQFGLRDAPTAGNPVGAARTLAPVDVSHGLFTVTLDFGATAFDGSARWLEIGVRTNGSAAAYTLLAPRQPITSAPYALYAAQAGNASVTFEGSGTATTAAHSDHDHTGSFWIGNGGLSVWNTNTPSGRGPSVSLNGFSVTDGTGVRGASGSGEANSGSDARGVWGNSSTGAGVYGSASGPGGAGVIGRALLAGGGIGVLGKSGGAGGNGVRAEASGEEGIGLYATGPKGIEVWGNPAIDAWGFDPKTGEFGVAGRFAGTIECGVIKATGLSGTALNISGTKNFRIDHPLDPANKYLYHASVESAEVLNLYSGNVTLDTNGAAVVQLPNWFGALNTGFRYQLTAVGAPGPNLYVAEEIHTNRFKIAGGKGGGKVSWQVTALRQDPYLKAHPLVVEAEKTGAERGKYLYPEGYGLSARDAIDAFDPTKASGARQRSRWDGTKP